MAGWFFRGEKGIWPRPVFENVNDVRSCLWSFDAAKVERRYMINQTDILDKPYRQNLSETVECKLCGALGMVRSW